MRVPRAPIGRLGRIGSHSASELLQKVIDTFSRRRQPIQELNSGNETASQRPILWHRDALALVSLLALRAPTRRRARMTHPTTTARCFTRALTARSGLVRRGRRRHPHAVARAAPSEQLDATDIRAEREPQRPPARRDTPSGLANVSAREARLGTTRETRPLRRQQ